MASLGPVAGMSADGDHSYSANHLHKVEMEANWKELGDLEAAR